MNLLELSNIELNQICHFIAVTRAGNNFTRAAEYLHIQDPAPVRQRIRSLEQELNIKLFVRNGTHLQLTPAGKVFLAEIELTLASLDRAITTAQRAHRGDIGFLSIGIASSISNTLLPDILRTFSDRFPDVELELRELTADRQIQALIDRQLDVGFEVIDESDHSEIESVPILEEPLIVALPTSHLFTKKSQIYLSDLKNEKVILPSIVEFPFYQKFIDYFKIAGYNLTIVENIKAAWLVTILSMVAAEIGIAILPSNVRVLQREGVVYKPIEDANFNRQISMIWRKDDPSIVLSQFREVVMNLPA